ncbi:MAG TPA: electron transfer flavoprotein subunit alpha/FixB family protein [Miltoncostaeaceae bacterium]|nr:electron transfer flavoprotein subunit alpha/FixB family protein [Miltoncostaeaceae bacterium]
MSTLVFLEHHEGTLQKGSLGALSKAASLDPDTAGVVIGSGVADIAAQAGRYGAARVFVADDEQLAAPLPQPRIDVIEALVREHGFDNVLFASSVLASDIAAGLSGRLDAGLNWDLNDVSTQDGELVGSTTALEDTVLVEVGWVGTPRIALFRSGALEPSESGGGDAPVENIGYAPAEHSAKAVMVEQAHEEQTGPSIEEADILVTGGRGLGGPEGFKPLEELAAAMGGAVASTRAVVDSNWYPYQTQIGQTGKTVAPKLYIGFGVSGAIQHKVGMQSSQTIVAINKDPNAPIFTFADFGVVGDVNDIVPKLTALVKERRGS